MDTNTVRYFLHDLQDIDNQINKLREEIRLLKELDVDKISISIITGMPTYHDGESNVEKLAIKRLEMIERKEMKLSEMVILRDKIEEALQGIREDTAIDYIMKERYLATKKKTLKDIAIIYRYGLDAIKKADQRFMQKVICKIRELNCEK